MTAFQPTAESDSRAQICALRYCPEPTVEMSARDVILFAVKDVAGLSLYARNGVRRRISEQDRVYIDELLEDLWDRSRIAPEQVFNQLSHLSAGPLVTDSVEWVDWMNASASRMIERYPDFSLFVRRS